MMRSLALFLSALASAAAFTGTPLVSRTVRRTSTLNMGGSSGFATTLEGKKARVAAVKELLDKSEMIFNIPAGQMTVQETETMRTSLPEGSTAMVVKNTLFRRAIEGSEWEPIKDKVQGPQMWFFIEEDIGGTIKAYKDFVKEVDKIESHPIQDGIIEGVAYDSKGVEAIGKLPSKLELYAKIAGAIKAVPTKVASAVKAPNAKLARAIKLATMPEGEE